MWLLAKNEIEKNREEREDNDEIKETILALEGGTRVWKSGRNRRIVFSLFDAHFSLNIKVGGGEEVEEKERKETKTTR